MHIYCAGPMRGIKDFGFPVFEAATRQLRELGHEVFNPAERDLTAGFKSVGMTGNEDLSEEGFDLRAALAADLAYITLTADALCVLPGWEKSSGARAEVATAHALGLPVVRDGGFIAVNRGNGFHESHRIMPELAPSGKIAPVTNITTARTAERIKLGFSVSDITTTMTGIMQDKLDEKKSRTNHPAGKRRTDSEEAHEYSLADPAYWPDNLPPISAEQRLGFNPDSVAAYQNIPDIVRATEPPVHPEVKAVIAALAQEKAASLGFDPTLETYENYVLRHPEQFATDGEIRSVSSTGAEKGVKLAMFHLFPSKAMTQIAEHYGRGARKYAENQYRAGYEYSKSYAAMQRHLVAWWGGEDIDTETGSSHLAAAAWHCITLMTFMDEHPEFDDRYPHASA